MPVIPALRRLGQEDLKFKASLGYIERPRLKKKKKKNTKTRSTLFSCSRKVGNSRCLRTNWIPMWLCPGCQRYHQATKFPSVVSTSHWASSSLPPLAHDSCRRQKCLSRTAAPLSPAFECTGPPIVCRAPPPLYIRASIVQKSKI
jgi:hypothetical protein